MNRKCYNSGKPAAKHSHCLLAMSPSTKTSVSSYKRMKIAFITFLLLSSCLLALPTFNEANQINNLDRLIKSKRSSNPPRAGSWVELYATDEYSPVYTAPQNGMMEADKILSLPGQPEGVDFDQYAGFVTVDPKAGRALFYYFVESPQDSSTKPLVLWLNGGPGCSSFGYGAMAELGPFRVNSDGKTLFRNDYAWNNVANILFLESPAGVGYSFSNTYSDYNHTGDQSTAKDAYAFLVNWLERFPQYKTRDFFITGESYAGHYVPQLAYTILLNNKNTNQTIINFKGIAIGNAWIDDSTSNMGMYDYAWTHALISDETNAAIHEHCDFVNGDFSKECDKRMEYYHLELGDIDIYNIYAPLCHNDKLSNGTTAGSVHIYDPCYGDYVHAYLNLPEVQRALHANATKWQSCRSYNWTDSPTTVLPIIQQLIQGGIRVWIYSGDVDARVPVTASRYSINSLKLSLEKPWYPWYTNQEVGGYVVAYKGVTFVTVRGSGHLVPMDKPECALVMISSFLQGKLPPAQI